MSTPKKKKFPVTVLLSGGIDSTACIHYYLQNNFDPTGLFVDYGQVVRKKEYESAKKVARFYDIPLNVVKVDLSEKFRKGEIKGRNGLFIILALMKFPLSSRLVALGIHSGTEYYDAGEQFFSTVNSLLSGYTNGSIRLDAPFIKWQKPMIFEYCKKHHVPILLTYSCEQVKWTPLSRQ